MNDGKDKRDLRINMEKFVASVAVFLKRKVGNPISLLVFFFNSFKPVGKLRGCRSRRKAEQKALLDSVPEL